ncbi:hypothetical protein U3516DRAFT_888759 [Neocallimastix sp. 'constans']|jgi:hypothetical protein
MKFSLNNNIVNLENVLSKVISSRRCSKGFRRSGNTWQPGRITNRRISTSNPWLEEFIRNSWTKSSIASPSITTLQSPISDLSFNGMEQSDISSYMNENIIDAQKKEMKGSNQLESFENLKENQMQEVFKMFLTGNKDKIQDITTKDEYFKALNEINPEQLIDCLKNLGEKIFDESKCTSKNDENNEAFDLYNSMNANDEVANTYLATPLDTPIGDSFLDESLLLDTSLSQKEMQNDMLSYVTNTKDPLNLVNYQLPSLASNNDSSLNGEMPSPEIFSPIQSNQSENQFIQPTPIEKPDDVDSTLLLNNIIQSSTPTEELEDLKLTSLFNNLYSDNSMIAQNELNTFSAPTQATVVSNKPNYIEELLNKELLNQLSGTTSSFDMLNGANSITSVNHKILDVSGTPLVNSVISPLQELPYPQIISPVVQNDNTLRPSSQNGKMILTPESTPLLINDSTTINDMNNELFTNASSILKNNMISSYETKGNSKLTTNNEVLDCEKVCSDLEKVNNILLEVLKSLPNDNESEIESNLEGNKFPTSEDIKFYKVKESKFDFTEENVSKLASLSPVELVQEDIEVHQISKRGKGRPRKPKKLFRCPFECCKRKFNREYNLKEHIRTHNPSRSKEYTCKICNESFYSSSVLNRHVSSIHEGERFCCKYCGRPFNRKDALRRHENTYCQKAKFEN